MSLRNALRDAIGTTEAGVGLPHWHHATGGTSSDPRDSDRAGVFVDRQQVLDAIDAVLATTRPSEDDPTVTDQPVEEDRP